MRPRLAVVATHPIPYYVPLYRLLARDGLDVRVFFASKVGIARVVDPGMGVEIVWKTDLLGGYEHEFLPHADRIGSTRFAEIDNPGVGASLARFRPDVVLIHGYMWRTAIRALLWCRSRRIPAMMISDGSLHSGTPPVTAALKSLVLPLVLRQYAAFLCIGDANDRYFETFGVPRDKRFRVPAMADEGFWACRERRTARRLAIRGRLGLKESDLAVLFVGKLIARKRPGDLLHALKLLAARPATPRRVVVLFAGDGEQRAALERTVAQARLPARFLGFVNIDALPGYHCAADVLAHPAEVETFGMIVLEAAILGLPLLLSDRVGALGPTSIARTGENALVYSCGDVAALARQLERLASEPELLRSLSEASLRISAEHDGRASLAGALAAVRYCLGRPSAGGAQPARTGLA
ncbi:MAG: glycosyltransferase family 4 protein [Bauldia sp.]